jgi:membrane-associated phospholipid phosphatase
MQSAPADTTKTRPVPPVFSHDPLSAVERGMSWRWVDVPFAFVDAASDAWVVALIALALFAWLESEVKDVLEAFLPLAIALVAAGGVALLARSVGAVPRPVGGSAPVLAPLLSRAFPSGQVGAVAAFATYALLAYGKRARAALVLAAAVTMARVATGGHWVAGLVGGGVVGLALGLVAYRAALRLVPRGHLHRLRESRRLGAGALADPPSA